MDFWNSKENCFRRGLIVAVPAENWCHVYYVDYGEVELLDTCFLFHIPEEFVAIRLYAARAALADPEGLELDEKVTEIFQKLVIGKSFRCQGTIYLIIFLII